MTKEEFINISPRDFECLCYAYVEKIYEDKNAEVILKEYRGDGGRDIEIRIPRNCPDFLHWGECKHHTRNIDLSTIGKNIVLVMSHKVKKIIFFSTSSIVYNTKKNIFEVARQHGFDTVFLDNEVLISEFVKCGLIDDYLNNKVEVEIEIFIEENETSGETTNYLKTANDKTFNLKGSDSFSFLIIIKNHSSECKKIDITLDMNGISYLKTVSGSQNITVPDFTDVSASFPMRAALNFADVKKLPDVTVGYDNKKLRFITGNISAKFHPEIPLIGSDAMIKIPYVSNLLSDTSSPEAIVILGKTGSGKSRWIREIVDRLNRAEIETFLFDCVNLQGLTAFIDPISKILALPLKRNDKIDKAIFDTIIKSKGIDNYVGDILYDFITRGQINDDQLKSLFVFIIEHLQRKKTPNIVLVFDNLEKAENSVLWFVSEILKHQNSGCHKIKLLVTSNPDSEFAKKNAEYKLTITELKIFNRKRKQKFIEIKEFDKTEQEMFCYESIGKASDKNVLYDKEAKDVLKYLLLTDNRLPEKFIEHKEIYQQVIERLIEERFIVYDINEHCYRFSYDKDYATSRQSIFFEDKKQKATEIVEWINSTAVQDLEIIKIKCLVECQKYTDAYKSAIEYVNNIKSYNNGHNYEDALLALLKCKGITIIPEDKFELTKRLASLYLFESNLDYGATYYRKAYLQSLNSNLNISESSRCQIRHEYINSLIHTGRYKSALDQLKNFDVKGIRQDKYKLLYYNRYAVIETFLYKPEEAEKHLYNALEIASAMNDIFWISTVYSDLGYLYLKTNRKSQAKHYFLMASELYSQCHTKELSRDIECAYQQALSYALGENSETALQYGNHALSICENNFKRFQWLKAGLIYGYTLVMAGNLLQAESIYTQIIERSKSINSRVYRFSAYAGVAVVYMLQDKKHVVDSMFNKVYREIKSPSFENMGAKMGALKNFALWYVRNNEFEKLQKVRELGFKKVNSYINLIMDYNGNEIDFGQYAQNAANIKGYSLMY